MENSTLYRCGGADAPVWSVRRQCERLSNVTTTGVLVWEGTGDYYYHPYCYRKCSRYHVYPCVAFVIYTIYFCSFFVGVKLVRDVFSGGYFYRLYVCVLRYFTSAGSNMTAFFSIAGLRYLRLSYKDSQESSYPSHVSVCPSRAFSCYCFCFRYEVSSKVGCLSYVGPSCERVAWRVEAS